ncbi:RpiB/LacA/LacB family sugar-phosphate isomerase, partial [Candidatus Dojkabacteria bacterium]|nr:RpiB/LacA/LacB family sugar-phosphate isomerase [Candidatus Dojkabacteria bacterium]
MQIFIASDHGGFELKQKLLAALPGLGYLDQQDLGPAELDPDDDYPPFAFAVGEKVALDPESIGILICRSGNGMAIAANKVKGVRAALCFSPEHATKAREDDHANVLALDADYAGADPLEIVKAFLSAEEHGGRHERRVEMIGEY